jgi:hypothetical protein
MFRPKESLAPPQSPLIIVNWTNEHIDKNRLFHIRLIVSNLGFTSQLIKHTLIFIHEWVGMVARVFKNTNMHEWTLII